MHQSVYNMYMIVYHAYRTDDSDLYQWIGLRNTNEPCACDATKPDEECEPCRNRWTWTDGTHATAFRSWLPYQPTDVTQSCALITQISYAEENPGNWGASPCKSELAFICKKGKQFITLNTKVAWCVQSFNLSTFEHKVSGRTRA